MASPGQNACDVLAPPFIQLKNPKIQREALLGLVERLTHHQLRELRSVVNSSDYAFHYDIIGELPVEISQIIIEYLPLKQCFRAQRVSRTWRKLLSSPQTVDLLLRWWYPEPETGLYIPDNLSAEAVISLKADHVDAFRAGLPFSKSTLSGMPKGLPANHIAYDSGVLAWINLDHSDPGSGRSIETLDLRTHLQKHFIAEDRTSFHAIAISTSIIAALDLTGRCHVWKSFHWEKRYLLRLPSASNERMVVSGSTLAIASSKQEDSQIEIITWSSQSEQTHSFLLSLHPTNPGGHREWKIMLDCTGDSFLLFQRTFGNCYDYGAYEDDGTPIKSGDFFYFTRTSLDGNIYAQGLCELPSPMSPRAAKFNSQSPEFTTIETNSFATLWLLEGRVGLFWDDFELVRIRFNFEQNQLNIERNEGLEYGFTETNRPSFFVWKDIVYLSNVGDRQAKIFDLKRSTCEFATNTRTGFPWRESENDEFSEDAKQWTLGDELFLVHVGPSECTVWCFDRNIQMPNEDLVYKDLGQKHWRR